MLIKRAMDTLYASVGAAMSWAEKHKGLSRFWMPIATAAASYYTLIGPGPKSQEVVTSPSPDLIKKAWGVISFPAVKTLSLHASRILKGAAIAERIIIADVPCIVLCRNKFPGEYFSILFTFNLWILNAITHYIMQFPWSSQLLQHH